MHLTSQPARDTLGKAHKVSFVFIYGDTNACRRWLFPGQPIERRWQIWPFFFVCYRYKKKKFCNWVQNPSHPLWLSNTCPIKLCNTRVNVLFPLNNQIVDWRPIGQRLFFLWENFLCPGTSLTGVFHNPVVPQCSQNRVSGPSRSQHSPSAPHKPGLIHTSREPSPCFLYLDPPECSWSSTWAMLNPLFTVRKEETHFREVKILQSLCTQE